MELFTVAINSVTWWARSRRTVLTRLPDMRDTDWAEISNTRPSSRSVNPLSSRWRRRRRVPAALIVFVSSDTSLRRREHSAQYRRPSPRFRPCASWSCPCRQRTGVSGSGAGSMMPSDSARVRSSSVLLAHGRRGGLRVSRGRCWSSRPVRGTLRTGWSQLERWSCLVPSGGPRPTDEAGRGEVAGTVYVSTRGDLVALWCGAHPPDPPTGRPTSRPGSVVVPGGTLTSTPSCPEPPARPAGIRPAAVRASGTRGAHRRPP